MPPSPPPLPYDTLSSSVVCRVVSEGRRRRRQWIEAQWRGGEVDGWWGNERGGRDRAGEGIDTHTHIHTHNK
jgi:hypothetical protein